MNLKELVAKVKAVFDAPPSSDTAQIPSNQAPSDTAGTPTVYTLQDGTQIAIQQAGSLPAPGDTVTIAGAPAPEGILTLQDGSTITCDATGAITLYTPAGGDPVTTDVGAADAAQKPPAAPALPAKAPIAGVPGKSGYNEQDVAALVARFDDPNATPADDMTVLKLCVKALMQSEFGWQILEQKRLADTNAAITAYQNSLQTLQASSQKFTEQAGKIAALEQENLKLKNTIAGMFEIMDELAKLPTADPKTLTTPKKEEMTEKKQRVEEKFKKIAADLRKVKADA